MIILFLQHAFEKWQCVFSRRTDAANEISRRRADAVPLADVRTVFEDVRQHGESMLDVPSAAQGVGRAHSHADAFVLEQRIEQQQQVVGQITQVTQATGTPIDDGRIVMLQARRERGLGRLTERRERQCGPPPNNRIVRR